MIINNFIGGNYIFYIYLKKFLYTLRENEIVVATIFLTTL